MITLILVTIPVEIIFLITLRWLGWLHPPIIFVAISIIFFCIAVSIQSIISIITDRISFHYVCQVSSSLVIARSLTSFLWSKNLDPDMYAMPIHSSLMDLIGQLLLVLCFEIVAFVGSRI